VRADEASGELTGLKRTGLPDGSVLEVPARQGCDLELAGAAELWTATSKGVALGSSTAGVSATGEVRL
jgi:hypothetical protein